MIEENNNGTIQDESNARTPFGTSEVIADCGPSEKAAAEHAPVQRNEYLHATLQSWMRDSEEEGGFTGAEKEGSMFKDVGVGLGLIVVTPVALGAAALAGAGAIIYGTGLVVTSIGRALTIPGKLVMEKMKARKR
jgi:hypothetical protein